MLMILAITLNYQKSCENVTEPQSPFVGVVLDQIKQSFGVQTESEIVGCARAKEEEIIADFDKVFPRWD